MAKQKQPPISGSVLEGISRILGDTENGLTGTEIARFLQEVNISDVAPSITKWKRLYSAFATFQNQQRCSNNILTFINISMNPARYIGNEQGFESQRYELNKRLSFIGLELTNKGQFRKTTESETISDAERRANKLIGKLRQRNTHPVIFTFCSAELLAENYFHSVFEAVKSIAEIIRQKTGLSGDGAELVDKAFSLKNPLIKINSLTTDTEESEHKGFVNLIKGVFGMFRNTTAHAPKIIWTIDEDDALDILSTISLIHRKLNP